jgi:hypothetical protein
MSKELSTTSQGQALNVFSNSDTFEHAQRIAKALASSTLVPTNYQNNMSNTLVALEMANRVGASPLMVMQNLNVIQGRPSWSSPFIIAAINSCGRFAPLKYKVENLGKKKVTYDFWTGSQGNRKKEQATIEIEDISCRAWTTDSSGEILDGPAVSIEMAVKEGWYTKSDSKWKTMPEVMLRYRAAAFFGRLYAPEIMLGMHTSEEVADGDMAADASTRNQNAVTSINQRVVQAEVIDAEVIEAEPIAPNPTPAAKNKPAPAEPAAEPQPQEHVGPIHNDDDLV